MPQTGYVSDDRPLSVWEPLSYRKDHISLLTLERYTGLASLRQSAGSKARSYKKNAVNDVSRGQR